MRRRRTRAERRALYINPDTIIEDLLRLAQWRKKPKPAVSFGERMKAVRKRKQKEALAKRIAFHKERWRRKHRPVLSLADRMVRAMAPGEWYGMGDMARMIGAGRQARGKVNQVLLPAGLVDRARNNEPPTRPDPWAIMAGAVAEPPYLYRLSSKGEAWRALLMLLD